MIEQEAVKLGTLHTYSHGKMFMRQCYRKQKMALFFCIPLSFITKIYIVSQLFIMFINLFMYLLSFHLGCKQDVGIIRNILLLNHFSSVSKTSKCTLLERPPLGLRHYLFPVGSHSSTSQQDLSLAYILHIQRILESQCIFNKFAECANKLTLYYF